MKFDIKHILIFGLALGMTSCVETMKDGDMSTGFLGVPVLDADIQVEEFGATKAAPALPKLSAPAASDLHFKVTDSKSNVVWNQKGLWSDPLQMPVGSYTIEVTYGSNTYGNPWYTGTCTVTISPVKEAVPAIGLRLCNSLLAVVLADDFTQHFTPSEGECVTISSTSGNSENSENIKSITTTLGNYVFVPSGEALTIQVAGTSSAGISKTLSWTLKNPLSAATATYVTCSLTTTKAPTITMSEIPAADAWGNTAYVPLATTANISPKNVAEMQYFASANNWTDSVEGTIVEIDRKKLVKFTGLKPGATYKVRAQLGALKSNEVSMTMSTSALSIKTAAAHTYTNNELDGTDFTASFSVAEKFGVTASSLQLCNSDGKVLRRVDHLTGTSADWTSDGSAITGDDIWPFLPGGKYILKGTATQNGSSVTLEEYQFTVPDTPDFTVSVSGKTTYDYSKTDINKANSLVAETIYEVGYSVSGIFNALLSNSNYGLACQYAINDKNVTSADGKITGCAWGINNLTATVTFAGKPQTSLALSCHITGLPYTAAPPTNTGSHPWSGNAKSWEGSFVRLHKGTITQTFHVPEDIDLSVYHEARIYTRADNTKYTFYIGGDIAYTKEQSSTLGKETYDKTTYNKYKFTPSQKSIKCENTYGTIDAGVEYTNVKVYNITVKYR